MILVLLRHGEASFEAASDRLRTLTIDGELDVCASTTSYLNHRIRLSGVDALQPTLLVSPYLRAQQTADLVGKTLTSNELQFYSQSGDWLTPETPVEDCIRMLQRLEGDGLNELWLISHNPLLSTLLSQLVDGDNFSQPALRTAEIVELELDWPALGSASIGYRH